MRYHNQQVLQWSVIALLGAALSGCGTGGEYSAPRTTPQTQNTEPATPTPQPPTETTPPIPPAPQSGDADGRFLCGEPNPGPGGEFGLQKELIERIRHGKDDDAFDLAFETGDKLFETAFTRDEGGGSKVGPNQYYTRIPRADLKGEGEWFNHKPDRPTGPNAQSCNECHNRPGDDGAGLIALNVHRDPFRNGNPKETIQRNTPHIFGAGALQLLAEEMTKELFDKRQEATAEVCASGTAKTIELTAKGLSFGRLKVKGCTNGFGVYDTSEVKGVTPDLVVRPYQWKKSVAFMRDFARGAANNEIGMQAVELAGEGQDKDGDGHVDELSYGQITSLTVYMAAQPRPTTKVELADLALAELKGIPLLEEGEREAISRGEYQFEQVGCSGCHKPSLTLEGSVYSEPSQSPEYRDGTFCSQQKPENVGVDYKRPVKFDLAKDVPENRNVPNVDGNPVSFGSFTEKNEHGHAVIRLYGDLRRHDMGQELAEQIDELGNGHQTSIQYLGGAKGSGSGQSTFGTKELWGLACTGPWLHDGRATTIKEAILAHGGDAAGSKEAFTALNEDQESDLLTFLNNLVLYKHADGQDVKAWAESCHIDID